MRAIHRKLLRDVSAARGQVLSIGLVLTAGVAMFVAYFSTFGSLRETRDTYYARYRFADLFAGATRVPLAVLPSLRTIDGVAAADSRMVVDVTLDVEGLEEPASGRLISLTLPATQRLNDVFIRRGRVPEPGRDDEALVSEAFAVAHDLGPGDAVTAVINGRRRRLTIVGVGLSPEYVYSIRAGDILPDPKRFGVFWMDRRALASAFDMEGAFNDVALTLAPGASEDAVREHVDRILRPYGGRGAVPRRLQISNWFLESEFVQLRTAGLAIPAVFFSVAIILLHVSLSRLVAVQREQIAALRALGYTSGELVRHYMGWSVAIAAVGAVGGVIGGAWLGREMTWMYNDFFRFPALEYRLSIREGAVAVAIGLGAGIFGAMMAVRRIARLAPAVAMRPPAPERFRRTWIERVGMRRRLSPVAATILRNTARQPVRALLSTVGVSLAIALLVVGLFFVDAFTILLQVQFETAQRQDMTIGFVRPVSASAAHDIAKLPGVLAIEPIRAAAVEIRSGPRRRQQVVIGLPIEPELHRVIDERESPIALAPSGLVMSTALADVLDVRPGDVVELEMLEGRRDVHSVVVSQIVTEYLGTALYMQRDALHGLLDEGGTISGAFLRVDRLHEAELYRRLKALPAIASVSIKRSALESFRQTIQESMLVLVFFNVLFSAVIACGVVYNAARIVLSERSRDLASLRVLGFSRAEVSAILLGELAIIVVLAIPAGLVVAQFLSAAIVMGLESELYRFPLVVTPRTRVFAVAVVLASAAVSGLLVRRRVDRLDLVAVLKTRE